MEPKEGKSDQEQILSVSNLEKFNHSMKAEEDTSLHQIIAEVDKDTQENSEYVKRNDEIVNYEEPTIDDTMNISKLGEKLLSESRTGKDKIVIPKRIVRKSDDTESESDSSSTLPDTSESEDNSRKLSESSTTSSDDTNSEENVSTGDEDTGSSSGSSSDDSAITCTAEDRTMEEGGINEELKNNEIIRNTMNDLHNKNKNMTRRTGDMKSTNNHLHIKTISSNSVNRINTNIEENKTQAKANVAPFDMHAARIHNSEPWMPQLIDSDNSLSNNVDGYCDPSVSGKSMNSTNMQDDTGKYFTVLHDTPRDGPCKKCPRMKFVNLKQWWKMQRSLAPRTRHSLRIGFIVLGSALLLLAIFLLARLPHSRNDVTHPMMYDLPADDAFRPMWPQNLEDFHDSSQVQDLQDLPPLPQVDHPDVIAGGDVARVAGGRPQAVLPGVSVNLEELARRKGVAFHPLLGVPVDKTYLQMEQDRKTRLAKLQAARGTVSMDTILDKVKQTIDNERKYMEGKEKKIWANGETPLRILLVSTWRSGSTFLGQVLQQHPGVFQHYEPFSYLGVRQIRSGPEAFQSQQVLHRLLDCRYEGQDQYLNYTKFNPVDMSGHNKRIWNACNTANRVDICSNATFLTKACNMFPIQLVKTVRLRLNLTQLFLGETRLNAKVIFLVRDPRATISSRRSSVKWCETSHDCSSPEVLCSDLKADLKVSAALERLYPNSFSMVRYEDLANDPQNTIKQLLEFLGMEFSDELSRFVAEHTESEVEKPWSIARKSAARVSRWKERLSDNEIENIQQVCKPVIETLGYDILVH